MGKIASGFVIASTFAALSVNSAKHRHACREYSQWSTRGGNPQGAVATKGGDCFVTLFLAMTPPERLLESYMWT